MKHRPHLIVLNLLEITGCLLQGAQWERTERPDHHNVLTMDGTRLLVRRVLPGGCLELEELTNDHYSDQYPDQRWF